MPFPDLPARLSEVRGRIGTAVQRGGHGQTVLIVAVTKTHGPDAVQAAWDAGLADVDCMWRWRGMALLMGRSAKPPVTHA